MTEDYCHQEHAKKVRIIPMVGSTESACHELFLCTAFHRHHGYLIQNTYSLTRYNRVSFVASSTAPITLKDTPSSLKFAWASSGWLFGFSPENMRNQPTGTIWRHVISGPLENPPASSRYCRKKLALRQERAARIITDDRVNWRIIRSCCRDIWCFTMTLNVNSRPWHQAAITRRTQLQSLLAENRPDFRFVQLSPTLLCPFHTSGFVPIIWYFFEHSCRILSSGIFNLINWMGGEMTPYQLTLCAYDPSCNRSRHHLASLELIGVIHIWTAYLLQNNSLIWWPC